jgi:hypothetical protein
VLEARLAKRRARLAHSPARVLVRFDHVAGQTRITASRNARGLIAQLLQVRIAPSTRASIRGEQNRLRQLLKDIAFRAASSIH